MILRRLGLIGLLLWSGLTPLWALDARKQEKLVELRDEVQTLRVELEFLNQKVGDSRKNIRRLEQQIDQQQEKVADLQKQIDGMASEAADIVGRISSLQTEVAGNQKQYAAVIGRFRKKLVQLHKIKQGTLLSSVFSAGDLNAFLSRYQMVRHLLWQDRQMLGDLQQVRTRLETSTTELQRKQDQLAQITLANQKSREKMLFESSSLSAMLKTLVLEKKILLKRQEKVQTDLSGIEGEIARIEQIRAANPVDFERDLDVGPRAAAPKTVIATASLRPGKKPEDRTVTIRPGTPPRTLADEPAGGRVATAGIRTPPPPQVAVPAAADADVARFIWPLSKYRTPVTSPEASGKALGIPPDGDPDVVAMATGKVLFKGPMGTMGNVVIIGHRKNFSTVYGRLHAIWVGLGQVVQQGEVIGKLIDPNDSLLHLEVRLAGKLQDPLQFLPPVAKGR